MGSAAWVAATLSDSVSAGLVRLKKACNSTAEIEVETMPSPNIGFSASGKAWKKAGIRQKPIEIATTRTLLR